MTFFIDLLSNIKLRTKILGVSALFLTGMSVVYIAGGYTLIKQMNAVESAVNAATKQILAATSAQVRIIQMDRAIRGLIAVDDRASIRTWAIASIRAGSELDENLANLKESIPDSAEVDQLLLAMQKLRPQQMKVISQAKRNKDEASLKLASELTSQAAEISTLVTGLVTSSQNQLDILLAESKRASYFILRVVGVMCFLGVALGVLISLGAIRMMSAPLITIEKSMRALADGDLTTNLELNSRGRDEICQTINAQKNTIISLREMVGKISGSSSQVSEQSKHIKSSVEQFEAVNSRLDETVCSIKAHTGSVTTAAESAVEKAQHALQNASLASSATSEAGDQVLQAVRSFADFQEEMKNTAQQSRELAATAAIITSITQTISNISDQTNLLALNAAIEAARAGEQGRGFAVVADEVRQLAGRTGDAVKEISELINTIGDNVDQTVLSIEKAQTDVDENIVQLKSAAEKSELSTQRARDISNAMQELMELIESQHEVTGKIVGSIQNLSEISVSNGQQSDSLGQLSDHLTEAAGDLDKVIQFFKL